MANNRPRLPHNKAALEAMRPKIKAEYLACYQETGLVQKSAVAVGTSSTTILNWRKDDPEFDEACKQALQTYCDEVEAEIHRRAITGVLEPVFYQGEQCGTIRRYSDRMLELHAKRHIPEYRDRQQVDLNVKGGVIVVPGMAPSAKQWEATDFDIETNSAALPVPAP